jgi:hypothetical protein
MPYRGMNDVMEDSAMNPYRTGALLTWDAPNPPVDPPEDHWDWSNVGRSRDWILADEQARQKAASAFGHDEIFWLTSDSNGLVSAVYQRTLAIRQSRTQSGWKHPFALALVRPG